jgi:hypothetical protein
MGRTVTSSVVTLLLAVSIASSALAQGAKWAKPYDSAMDAIKKGQYREAIPFLEQAIAADPTPQANKRVEGTFSEDYFPQYYLFVAYLKTNQTDKARTYFNQRGPLPQKLNAEATTLMAELNKAEGTKLALADFDPLVSKADAAYNAKQWAAAVTSYEAAKAKLPDEFQKRNLQAKLDTANGNVAAEKAAQTNLADFETIVGRANAALSNKQYDVAMRELDAAKAKLPAEYTKRGLEARATEARTAIENKRKADAAQATAQTAVATGQRLLTEGKVNEAKAQFQNALAQVPGLKEANDGLGAVTRRETDYTAAKTKADQLFKASNLQQARELYGQAQKAHPQYFDRDKLGDTTLAIDKKLGAEVAINAARKAFGAKQWVEAANQAANVLKADPNNQEMQKLRTQADARVALDAGRSLAASKNYTEAAVKLRDAKTKDPSLADAANELTRVEKMIADNKKAEEDRVAAAKKVEEERIAAAKKVEEDRLAAEKLAALGKAERERLAREQAEKVAAAAKASDTAGDTGLRALFAGDLPSAVKSLNEAVANAGGGKYKATTLHAYLGVAYATIALQAPDKKAESENRAKALDEFRKTGSYSFPPNLVSPRVRELFDEAKRAGSNH